MKNKVDSEIKDNSKLSFREKMKDKKYSAKVQLIGYGIFILLVFLYASISSKNYNYNNTTNSINDIVIPNKTSEVKEEVSLFDSISSNYDYSIEVSIKARDDNGQLVDKVYTYNGSSNKNLFSISVEDKTYYLKNDVFYTLNNDNYEKVDFEDVIDEDIFKYIYFENIFKYIDKAVLDHTTNYSSGEIVSTYYLYLKDIFSNYFENDYVVIDIDEKNEVLNIDIDYTNLVKYEDDDVNKFIVNAIYSNINTSTGLDDIVIDINN